MVKLNLLERFLNKIHAKADDFPQISTYTMDLPAPLKDQTLTAAPEKQTQPDLAPLVSGIDDTLNNDFFYDEEFTIPFDANLVEDCQSLPVEVGSLLRTIFPGGTGDGNLEWQHARIAPSKSDSCLYQADQELSDSEREMSMSDHNGSRSSDNSPLQNQSLFSSCGEPGCDDISGCHAEISDSALSGSLSRDPDKYNYDWSEGKQQYVLLFDRSPTKAYSSEEESCHQVADTKTRTKVTSWLRTKPSKQRHTDEDPGCNLSPVGKTEKERRTNSGLTTWGQVKSQQQNTGFTTWQQVKKAQPSSFRNVLAVARNAVQKDEGRMATVFEELSSPPSTDVNTAVEIKILPDEECHSRRLFNFYCKLKTQDEMSEFENNEGMASPLSAEKLVDPWTELFMAGNPGKTVETMHNFDHDTPVLRGKGAWSEMDNSDLRKPNGRVADVAPVVGFDRNVSTKSPDRATNAEQAGSPVLTASLLRGHDTVDCSIQFPPASMDCSVQTSFQFSGSSQSSVTESKAQQTSVIASVALPQSSPTGDVTESAKVGGGKMVRSAHLLSRPLPDLSFLNKSASQQDGKVDEVKSAQREAKRESNGVKQLPKTTSNHDNDCHGGGSAGKTVPQRPTNAKALNSSDSRDSSPNPVLCRNRSRNSDSASTYSVSSTSSSGIDPGFCDSSGSGTKTPRQSRIFDDVSRTMPIQAAPELSKIPPKPPRIFAANTETALQNQTINQTNPEFETKDKGDNKSNNFVGICNVCNSQILSGKIVAKNLVTSHPTYDRETKDPSSLTKQFDYLHISPTHSRTHAIGGDNSPFVMRRLNHDSLTHRHGFPRYSRGKDHVIMRGNQQQAAKPAKSILVRRRQRNQAKHRSWSNSSCEIDEIGPQQGNVPGYLVREGRPMSLPDENLLHQGLSGVLEEQGEVQDTCGIEEASSISQTRITEDENADWEVEIQDEDCDYERFKAKKSVSFSEKIFYHSTSATNSPLDSPKCPQVEPINSPVQTTLTLAATPKKSVECKLQVDVNNFKTDMDDSELPPTDFMVSPNMSPASSLSSSDMSLSTDILHKRELVFDVMRAVEVLVKHFSQTRDATRKVQLGSTVENADVGQLVLDHLCPAIHAVILDGLKPHVNSLFGKVKNSAYKVMEDSAELGQPVELIQYLVKSLKSLKFLNTPWILFNAFIFGLLNFKALDFWLTYIHNHKLLQAKHYNSSSFIHLSNSTAHRLFLDMITSLQPLAQMPFRLEYGFETRLLERRQQEQLAKYLLDQHVSRSVETYVEGQQFLAQLHNLSSSQQAFRQNEALMAAPESNLRQRTKQLWQKTQHQLFEKLSLSKERLTSESTVLVRNVARATFARRPRPMSFPGTSFQDDALSYGNFVHHTMSSVRSLSNGESAELMGGEGECQLVESSESESDDGFFARVAKQLKDMNLRERVYKRGATNYSFEDSFSSASSSQKIEAQNENAVAVSGMRSDRGCPTTEPKSDFAACSSSGALAQVTPSVVPRSDVRSEGERVKSCPSNAVQTHNANVKTPTSGAHVRASPAETASAKVVSADGTTCSLDPVLVNYSVKPSSGPTPLSSAARHNSPQLNGSASRKRWSDIGSHLVNIFDRLLLSDSKVTSSAPSSVTSSSELKCSSASHVNVTSLGDVHRSKVKQLSSSVNGSQFMRASSLDSTRNNAKAFEPTTASKCQRRAVTLCHYVATDSRQLSFEKGTLVVVLQEDCNADWKLCRIGQNAGLVHGACIRPDDGTAGGGGGGGHSPK